MVAAGAFRTNRSPWAACVKACSTRSTDSARDIRKRVIAGSVTVSGWPARNCCTNRGITEPRDHITLPYRVSAIVIPLAWVRAKACAVFSIRAFVIPIALTG